MKKHSSFNLEDLSGLSLVSVVSEKNLLGRIWTEDFVDRVSLAL